MYIQLFSIIIESPGNRPNYLSQANRVLFRGEEASDHT